MPGTTPSPSPTLSSSALSQLQALAGVGSNGPALGTPVVIGGQTYRVRQNPQTGQPEYLQADGNAWGDISTAAPQAKAPVDNTLAYLTTWAKTASAGDTLTQGGYTYTANGKGSYAASRSVAPVSGMGAIDAWAKNASAGATQTYGGQVYTADGKGSYSAQPERVSATGIGTMVWDPVTQSYEPPAGSSAELSARTAQEQASAASQQAIANKTTAELPGSLTATDLANQKSLNDLRGTLATNLSQIDSMVASGQINADQGAAMKQGLVKQAIQQYQSGLTPQDIQTAYQKSVSDALTARQQDITSSDNRASTAATLMDNALSTSNAAAKNGSFVAGNLAYQELQDAPQFLGSMGVTNPTPYTPPPFVAPSLNSDPSQTVTPSQASMMMGLKAAGLSDQDAALAVARAYGIDTSNVTGAAGGTSNPANIGLNGPMPGPGSAALSAMAANGSGPSQFAAPNPNPPAGS